MSGRFLVRAHLRDTVTGFARIYETEYDQLDGIEFHWHEGNFACDCNRALFLWDWNQALSCNVGENRVVLDRLEIQPATEAKEER